MTSLWRREMTNRVRADDLLQKVIGGQSQTILAELWETVEGVTLVVQELLHAGVLDSPTLSQTYVLVLQDLLHGQTIDSPELTQAHTLAVSDVLHAHGLESKALTQAHLLAIQEMLHSQTLDNGALTQVHSLAVQDLLHSIALDGVVLQSGSVTLVVAGLEHAHGLDTAELIQHLTLAVQGLEHGHGTGAIDLTQAHILSVDGMGHAQTVEIPALERTFVLALQGLLHGNELRRVNFFIAQGQFTTSIEEKIPMIRILAQVTGMRASIEAGKATATITTSRPRMSIDATIPRIRIGRAA